MGVCLSCLRSVYIHVPGTEVESDELSGIPSLPQASGAVTVSNFFSRSYRSALSQSVDIFFSSSVRSSG